MAEFTILSKTTEPVVYFPSPYQQSLTASSDPRMLIISARQNGTSTAFHVEAVDVARKNPGVLIYFVVHNTNAIDHVARRLRYIAFRALPEMDFKSRKTEVEFANGSLVVVKSASYRMKGQIECPSRIYLEQADFMREEDVDYWINYASARRDVLSMPVTMLKPARRSYARLIALRAYKQKSKVALRFSPWWENPDNTADSDKWMARTREQRAWVEDYFSEIEIMTGANILEDSSRKEWYASRLDIMGWDNMRREYPSFIEEVLFS